MDTKLNITSNNTDSTEVMLLWIDDNGEKQKRIVRLNDTMPVYSDAPLGCHVFVKGKQNSNTGYITLDQSSLISDKE